MRYSCYSLFLVLILFGCRVQAQHRSTVFEASGGTETPVYFEIRDWWQSLAAASPLVSLRNMDTTDSGYPLQLVLIQNSSDTSLASLKKKGKNIILINNGIHPGEPDGIDASMLLARDIAEKKYRLPDNVVLAIIPVYNIGGCLNRSETYRVDQNGPVAFGFRGNAQNLDLNRDFIKCDSKNAFAFARIFHLLDPDIQIDNHVSNGADYQHIITLLSTQHNKLGGTAGEYLHHTLEPSVYSLMKEKQYDLVPYVNHFGDNTPDVGWTEFWDSPRYSSGYSALFGTFAFMPETHMLKPYDQRVKATLALMKSFIEFTGHNGAALTAIRAKAKEEIMHETQFPLRWQADSTQPATITFKGYEAGKKSSALSGLPVLFYDRAKPYTKQIPFYNEYKPVVFANKPRAYLVPQGWWKVIERLKANNVWLQPLPRDTVMLVQWYRVEDYKASARPFEGHHMNQNISTSLHTDTLRFRKGDFYIPMNRATDRFVIETLEPAGEDSYFTWNFFDAVLGQKEYFSDYVFEQTAAAYLQTHPEVKKALVARQNTDSLFAHSAAAQLDFVYRHSPYAEAAYLRYPVYRVP